jgi:hypothetical protein
LPESLSGLAIPAAGHRFPPDNDAITGETSKTAETICFMP